MGYRTAALKAVQSSPVTLFEKHNCFEWDSHPQKGGRCFELFQQVRRKSITNSGILISAYINSLRTVFWCFLILRAHRYYLGKMLRTLCGFWLLKPIVATGRQCCPVTVFSRANGWIWRLGLNLQGIQMSPRKCFSLASFLNLAKILGCP